MQRSLGVFWAIFLSICSIGCTASGPQRGGLSYVRKTPDAEFEDSVTGATLRWYASERILQVSDAGGALVYCSEDEDLDLCILKPFPILIPSAGKRMVVKSFDGMEISAFVREKYNGRPGQCNAQRLEVVVKDSYHDDYFVYNFSNTLGLLRISELGKDEFGNVIPLASYSLRSGAWLDGVVACPFLQIK